MVDPLSAEVITMSGLCVRCLRAEISEGERLGLGLRAVRKEGSEIFDKRRFVKISRGWLDGSGLGS